MATHTGNEWSLPGPIKSTDTNDTAELCSERGFERRDALSSRTFHAQTPRVFLAVWRMSVVTSWRERNPSKRK
eukprot:1596315-Rhodomonas_salina.2